MWRKDMTKICSERIGVALCGTRFAQAKQPANKEHVPVCLHLMAQPDKHATIIIL